MGRRRARGSASSRGDRRAVIKPPEPAAVDLGSRDVAGPARKRSPRVRAGATHPRSFLKIINTLIRCISAWLRKLRRPKLSQIANAELGRGDRSAFLAIGIGTAPTPHRRISPVRLRTASGRPARSDSSLDHEDAVTVAKAEPTPPGRGVTGTFCGTTWPDRTEPE